MFVGDEDDDDRRKIAEVTVLTDDRLMLVSVEPEFEQKVNRLIEEMNASNELFQVIPSAEDAGRYALEHKRVVRGDLDFLPAIRDNVERYFGIDLVEE